MSSLLSAQLLKLGTALESKTVSLGTRYGFTRWTERMDVFWQVGKLTPEPGAIAPGSCLRHTLEHKNK